MYISYRNIISNNRLAAIYHNDKKNIKSRYEILYDVNLKDEVQNTVKDTQVKLEKVLMEVKNHNNLLFLAIE